MTFLGWILWWLNWHWLLADACLCAITILILSLWLSQNLLLFNHSPALAGNCLCFEWPLPLAGCAGCSLGWGYCTDRLDLDDLQAPTVAAKALGRTLHAENFSELIWKFDPVRIVRILLFDSVTWGWFPLWAALWAALCSTLPPKLPPRNGSERFWTIVGVFTHGVWARLDQLLGVFCVFIVVLNDFRGFNPPGKDLKRKDSTTQKTAVKSELGIEPFQGFVQRINWIVIVMFTFINIRLLFYDLHSVRRFSLLRHFLI